MRKISFLLAGVSIWLGGCTVGPDFKSPPAPATDRYIKEPLPAAAEASVMPAQQFQPGEDIPAQWWSLFHSKELDALIRQVEANNPDLQSAQAALKAAMENVKAQIGSFYPQVTAGLNASRNKDAAELSPRLAAPILLYNLYQDQLAVSWTPDIWGGNKRQVEALQAQADSQRFQLEATYVALTSNTVAAAIQAASLRDQIAATSEIIAEEKHILDIERRQQSLGQISGGDVASQETALAQAEEALPPLQKQLAQQQDLLASLAGHLPAEAADTELRLSALALPQALPVSLPSLLVTHRADVRAAEENMHMASAEIGVSIASRLPNITLSADAGTVATQLGQLATPGNEFWSVGLGLTQPIFDGGTLAHRTESARDTYDQMAAQYRGVVIAAFQNVADALYAIRADTDALNKAVAARNAAEKSLAITRRQLTLGQISQVALLNAEQADQQTKLAVIQAEANRFSETAALFQALGGDWWDNPDQAGSPGSG